MRAGADSTGVLTWVLAGHLLALFIDLLQLLLQLLQSCLCHVLQEFSIKCPLVPVMQWSRSLARIRVAEANAGESGQF